MDRADGFGPSGCGFNSCRARMRFLKFIIGWPLSAVALFYVGKLIVANSKNVHINISDLNFLLLFSGVFCFFLYYFVRTYIWKIILKEQGYNISQKKASFLWEVSELRRFVPGNIWSFLSRGTLFSDVNVPARSVAKALVIEIESFLLACFGISALTIYIYPDFLPINIPDIFFVLLIIALLFSTLLFINHSLLTKYIKGRLLSKAKIFFPNFPPKTNTYILLVSFLYLLLFGFGTYFTITSLMFISPEHFIKLSMFFVAALLIGYLSFLTPMGLGVRESAIIAGLSQFIPLGIAGFMSIFARIVLIASELSFLLITYLWQKIRSKYITNLENFVAIHKQEVIMVTLTVIYVMYFTLTAFLRYDNFFTGRFDLGNMDQTVWNTIHGRIFEFTDPNGTEIVSRLAFHADFILILLAPFYLLWEDPRMLLFIQTVMLAAGTIFVYKIANNSIKSKNISLVFGIAFLLNPAIQYTNLYDFHPVTLATTFLLGTFYFLLKKRYVLFLFFAFLAAITKEQVWTIIGLFGIYIFFYYKSKRVLGVSMFVLSLVVFYFLVWHAIPNALGSEHFALSYYSDFGDSPTNIIKSIFTSPDKLFSVFAQREQLHYLSQLFLPLGFLSILSPVTLIFALPDLFINLLSNKPQLHQIYYQYSATITPFIFISAIYGVRYIKFLFPKLPNVLVVCYLLIVACYSAYTFGPLPFSKSPNIDMYTKPQKNKAEIEKFISGIPPEYSVSATNSVGSHLAHRQKLYNVPLGANTADYIVFLLDGHFAQPSLDAQYEMVEKLKKNKNYSVVLTIDNFIVFEKKGVR